MSRLTINLDISLHDRLKIMARNRGLSLSGLVAEAARFYLDEFTRRQPGGRILELSGRAGITPETYNSLDAGRSDHDHRA